MSKTHKSFRKVISRFYMFKIDVKILQAFTFENKTVKSIGEIENLKQIKAVTSSKVIGEYISDK